MKEGQIKILVADDDQDVLAGIIDVLETEGFIVHSATNGTEAIAKVREFQPDLIICDVIMPIMSGYELLEQLKQDISLATIPFIFLTAHAEKDSLRLGMDLGADDYLTKPIDRQELLRAITARLQKHDFLKQGTTAKLNALRRSITMSLPHELRTPLNGILGMADILIEEADLLQPSEIKEIAQDIRKCGDRLNRLIQNFLLYAELEAGVTQTPQTTILTPIKELTTKIAQKCAMQHDRLEDLVLDMTDALLPIPSPRWIKIMEELIDNSFRYSLKGQTVQIISKWHHDQLVIEIKDCGRGMTSEQIANLGAYMQFDRRIYEQQGTGLGLTIAKRLVEFYGGIMSIESTPVTGTTIYLTFPVSEKNPPHTTWKGLDLG